MCLNRAYTVLVIGLAVAAPASAQTCLPPPSGLIAWWDGDARAGNTAIDIAGGFDGNLVGDATTVSGQVGDAFSFDGAGDYVQLPIDSGIFTTDQFTVDAWAFPTKLSCCAYLQGILDNDTLSLDRRGMTLAVFGGVWPPFSNQVVAGVFHNPDKTQYYVGPFPTVTNQWHHYALTYDGEELCLYQDGLQEGCVDASGPVIDNDVNFRIGHGQADTAIQRFFAGKIDEVEIFDRALSAAEIEAIFDAGSAGKCKVQDQDGDGVTDDIDVCADTVIPEAGVPSRSLGTNRFALVDEDGVFNTKSPNGKGPRKSFTIEDTGGCSCEQIIAAQGLGRGHTRHGCSISAMETWVALVNPAPSPSSAVVSGSSPTDVFAKPEQGGIKREEVELKRPEPRLKRKEHRFGRDEP